MRFEELVIFSVKYKQTSFQKLIIIHFNATFVYIEDFLRILYTYNIFVCWEDSFVLS